MNGKIKKYIAAAVAAVCALSVCACGSVSTGNNVGDVGSIGNIDDGNNGNNGNNGNTGDNGNNGNNSNTGNNGGATAKALVLNSPAAAKPLDHAQNTDESFCMFKSKVESFAARFTAQTYSGTSYAVSPVSVYMALALAAQCADGQTKTEIVNALGVDSGTLASDISLLYRSLENEYTVRSDGSDKLTGMIKLGNSIWLNNGTDVKRSCLDELAEQYYCYSYSADFLNENESANQAVREFVSDQTKGLIDKDFGLKTETVFALINTLYLKDVWTVFGDELFMTDQIYTFIGKNSQKDVKLLRGDYNHGKALVTQEYSAFYTATANGNKIKFIVPNDGYTVDRVFNAENIRAVNSYDFESNAIDHENKIAYNTRCLFPEYKAKFDDDVAPVLKNAFGIKQLFESNKCDMSSLTDTKVYCSKVAHVTDLTVDKKGMEGAAVTVVEMDATAIPPEYDYENVYQTFTVDKSFGFIITNSFDTTLFSGVITDL